MNIIARYTGGAHRELPEPVEQGDWLDIVQVFDNTYLPGR